MYTLTTIFADRREDQVDLFEEEPPLEYYHTQLETDIMETVPYFTTYGDAPCVAFCDEEGKYKDREINFWANVHWFTCAPNMRGRDILVGNVVVITADDPAMLRRL